MLSRQAFNALLKTLEEPPEQVKFIFATTEIRKIPVTVLSRCQRFDLRRVDIDTLSAHFNAIAGTEAAELEAEATALIARAAEGSVRDGISLLDQAIGHSGGKVTAATVRDMLGLADRDRVHDLFEAVMRGEMAGALDLLREQYDLGVDPEVVLQDMLELTHWLTRLKLMPGLETAASEVERQRGEALADGLAMAVLARTWQMLLKGLGEVRAAPSALSAAEMVLVRIAYVAELPPPGEVIRRLEAEAGDRSAGPPPANDPAGQPAPPSAAARTVEAVVPEAAPAAPAAEPTPDPTPDPTPRPVSAVPSFEALVALAVERKEGVLSGLLHHNVRLVSFAPGRLEFQPAGNAPADLAATLGRKLAELTGRRWQVSVNREAESQPTPAERDAQARQTLFHDAAAHPTVQAVLETFPGAEIRAVRELGDAGPEPQEQEER